MQTHLAERYRDTDEGRTAEAILRKCVHCGFCTATCPTYQLLGDELDGPRGRIYLIKEVLEGKTPTRATQLHLDRCLTCRNCETTCPSGVEYGALLEIGRELVEAQVSRPLGERAARRLLRDGLVSPAFGPAVNLGRKVRRWLPATLRNKLPPDTPPDIPTTPPTAATDSPRDDPHDAPTDTTPVLPGGIGSQQHAPARDARRMWMLDGCVQPTLAPEINHATRRVLELAGIEVASSARAGCCGAIALHLADTRGAHDQMRRNIDAWWPDIEAGRMEAIVMNASGCGVTVRDYGRLLAHDPHYAAKAREISSRVRDLAELLPELQQALAARGVDQPLAGQRLVVHTPCTLQHGQRLPDQLATGLAALGAQVRGPHTEPQMCCGSAGTYAVLQPELATQLRDRKLAALSPQDSEMVVSANIGCLQHLQSGCDRPVRHWIEVLDRQLAQHLPTTPARGATPSRQPAPPAAASATPPQS